MSDEIFYCSECGFKCVQAQLAKSKGKCPVCQKARKEMSDKFGGVVV